MKFQHFLISSQNVTFISINCNVLGRNQEFLKLHMVMVTRILIKNPLWNLSCFAIFWKLHNDFQNHHTFSRFCWPICACSPFVYIYTPEQRCQIMNFQKISQIFWKHLKNSETITGITCQKPLIKPVVSWYFWPWASSRSKTLINLWFLDAFGPPKMLKIRK